MLEEGDVWDIGQTVNGVSRFLWYNSKWFYFEERLTREYEYSGEELTALIRRDMMEGWEEVTYLGNIFTAFKSIENGK